MENSDWAFADVYDDDLARGDVAGAAQVRRDYLAFTRATVSWYKRASVTLLGREIRFVFLLHASRLNADCMDAIAAILAYAHLRSVTLDRAMGDPAYRLRDDYAGLDGDEWLGRWSGTLHKDLPYGSLPMVPAYVDAAERRIAAQPASLAAPH